MQPTAITIECKHCHGKGRVPLAPHLEQTLDLFRTGARQSATVIKELLAADTTVPAMNARLEELRLVWARTCPDLSAKRNAP